MHSLTPTAAIAVAAGILSIVNFYFQWFRLKRAKVHFLNDGQEQGSVPRPYDRLPHSAQIDFPAYDEKHPLYALVRLVFANTGDSPGFAKLCKITATAPWSMLTPADKIQVSNYTYILVPPQSVADRVIMLRNIPVLTENARVDIALEIETGGPSGRVSDVLKSESRRCSMTVVLEPAADTQRVITTKTTS